MIRAVDIKAELAGRPVLRERDEKTTEAEATAAFAVLAPFRDGGIFAGSFSGESPWERHPNGDELVQITRALASVPRPGPGDGLDGDPATYRPHKRGGPENGRVAGGL
jgi:hypothetical protein